MIFPIGDTNVKGGYKPLFSYSLIVLNIAFFVVQLITPGNLVCERALIPVDVLNGTNQATLFSSMFLHGGWMHLIGNMLFLWVFADNIEAIVGNFKFLIFYLLGGLVAAGVHIYFTVATGIDAANCCMPCGTADGCELVTNLCAGYVPSLGASGAISAVMGAYIVLFPRSRVKVLFVVFPVYLPAIVFLGIWFAEQLMAGIGAIGPMTAQAAGVAWWAHIGGFVFGVLFGLFNRSKMKDVVYHIRDDMDP